jgi:aryl-alcohol dehydrogenase-like predicted oxidoreductase
MRTTGEGISGPPANRDEGKAVLRRAVELGVNFIITADSYGPHLSEELISEALARTG